jgi:hypothetical protein
MTPGTQTLLLWVLGALLTITLFVLQRVFAKLDARDTEIAALREANLTYRLAIIELKGTQGAVRATLDALPTSVGRQEGTSP